MGLIYTHLRIVQQSQSSETKKSNMATWRPFWRWHCWESIGSYIYIYILYIYIYISNVLLKRGFDIQSQTKVRVQKPKNPIWPPGSHFDSNIAENLYASTHSHTRYTPEIWKWNSKANLSYAAKTMPPTDSRKINMATRRPFWKWCRWKSIGSYPYT